MGTVQILLPTYNGEKYLKEQIESLLAQTYSDIEILIRDDGSRDGTISLLQEYGERKNITVLFGENLGVIDSFFELVRLSSPNANYFAFCDQDDVWKPEKINVAVQAINQIPADIPAMYCSDVELVNEELNYLGRLRPRKKGHLFANALVQSSATGCTIVMNRAARQLLLEKLPDSQFVVMHDWWVYLVISAFGKVVYDETPFVLYRQHQGNTLGSGHKSIGRWIGRFQRFIKRNEYRFISRQTQLFYDMYGEKLSGRNKEIIEKFIQKRRTLLGRMQYVFSGEVYRQTFIEDIVCRILLALNLI